MTHEINSPQPSDEAREAAIRQQNDHIDVEFLFEQLDAARAENATLKADLEAANLFADDFKPIVDEVISLGEKLEDQGLITPQDRKSRSAIAFLRAELARLRSTAPSGDAERLANELAHKVLAVMNKPNSSHWITEMVRQFAPALGDLRAENERLRKAGETFLKWIFWSAEEDGCEWNSITTPEPVVTFAAALASPQPDAGARGEERHLTASEMRILDKALLASSRLIHEGELVPSPSPEAAPPSWDMLREAGELVDSPDFTKACAILYKNYESHLLVDLIAAALTRRDRAAAEKMREAILQAALKAAAANVSIIRAIRNVPLPPDATS